MSRINKLTTSFIKITNALDKTKNQDEHNMYVSMLDEEELECLKYVQRLRKYNKQATVAFPYGYQRREQAGEEEEGKEKEGRGKRRRGYV